jgi:putative lipoprotein
MAAKGLQMKRVALISMWLALLVQPSWGQAVGGVFITFHSPQSDIPEILDKWFARDKAEHLAVSAFLSGVSCSIFRDFYYNKEKSSVGLSAILTFSAGLGKELYDTRAPGGKFSYKDLVADALGIAVGLWIATR